MYQNPPRYVPGPAVHAVAAPARRRGILPIVLPFVLFGLLFFGCSYAYLTTDSGLVVVDLADGVVVAEDPGIGGLGDAFVAAPGAYAHDREGRRILTVNVTGDVLEISLGQTTATPVDSRTAAAWAGRLSGDSVPASPSEPTAGEAAVSPGERAVLRDLPVAAHGQERVRVTVVGGNAAGAGTGHVLVQHQVSVNDDEVVLSAVTRVEVGATGFFGGAS